MFKCSNIQMSKIKCQISTKLNLLSERTSGVSPVLFTFTFLFLTLPHHLTCQGWESKKAMTKTFASRNWNGQSFPWHRLEYAKVLLCLIRESFHNFSKPIRSGAADWARTAELQNEKKTNLSQFWTKQNWMNWVWFRLNMDKQVHTDNWSPKTAETSFPSLSLRLKLDKISSDIPKSSLCHQTLGWPGKAEVFQEAWLQQNWGLPTSL